MNIAKHSGIISNWKATESYGFLDFSVLQVGNDFIQNTRAKHTFLPFLQANHGKNVTTWVYREGKLKELVALKQSDGTLFLKKMPEMGVISWAFSLLTAPFLIGIVMIISNNNSKKLNGFLKRLETESSNHVYL